MKRRNRKDYLFLGLRGMGMGAADIVPGVSGGTIALITGIYEELIDSLKAFDLKALELLRRGRLTELSVHLNLRFLAAVLAGILLSALSLAKLMTYLLANQPIALWSFFFGLILASAFTVGMRVRRWSAGPALLAVLGTAGSFALTELSPAQTPESLSFVFLTGAIAICAMILPGISGSFILLLMGKYQYIMGSLSGGKIPVILVFALGAGIGLLSFSRLLSWLLHRFHDGMIALLAGFMLGALNKIWPWKRTLETFIDRHGEEKPLVQENILPGAFEGEPQLGLAIGLFVLGVGVIMALERPWQRP